MMMQFEFEHIISEWDTAVQSVQYQFELKR